MENEVTLIHLENKIAAIVPTDWDYNFNPDEVLKIDPYNIYGEIITIPVLVNRMGLLVADMRHYVKESKIRLELKEAEIRKLFRNQRSSQGMKSPTVQETDDHLTLDPVVKNLRLKLIRNEADLERLESIYNAVKDKSFKLNNISKSLVPSDFEKELVEGVVNGLMIKLRDRKY
jgi:hypothetical protein